MGEGFMAIMTFCHASGTKPLRRFYIRGFSYDSKEV